MPEVRSRGDMVLVDDRRKALWCTSSRVRVQNSQNSKVDPKWFQLQETPESATLTELRVEFSLSWLAAFAAFTATRVTIRHRRGKSWLLPPMDLPRCT